MGPSTASSLTVVNGVVYIGSGDHKVYAFNAATGAILWTATTTNDIISSPAVANGVVYVGSEDFKLYAFNASTGATLWTATTGSYINSPSPAVANGVVYIGSSDHKVYAFNASTGAILWTYATGGDIEFLTSGSQWNGVHRFARLHALCVPSARRNSLINKELGNSHCVNSQKGSLI